MKILIIARHAKAVSGNNTGDIERVLSNEGIEEIKKVGLYFKKMDITPDLAICSVAKRAKETLALFIKHSGINPKVIYDETIYDNNENSIINLISKTLKSTDILMMVGHLPSVENLVRILTDEAGRVYKFNTSGLAILKFEMNSWNEIFSTKGILESYISPEMI